MKFKPTPTKDKEKQNKTKIPKEANWFNCSIRQLLIEARINDALTLKLQGKVTKP